MVGLKTFWILISALAFVACVPQTKQTECASNEAFNASLRTCVPVVQGSSSFINITNFVPQFTQTRSKNDTTPLTFSISVDNPYNQSYSVEWERVFNAAPTYMCSNSHTCSFSASFLGTTLGEVGVHILTAKIKDTKGAVVDSHSFQLKINELPRPAIALPVDPVALSMTVLPTDGRIPFSFTIRNNSSLISPSDNYRTTWTVLKNGQPYLTELDPFSDYSASGSNVAYLGTDPTPAFNPATFGVGSYTIRASVQNDVPGEIVAEQYWHVIVKQPDLSKVSTISSPAPGVVTTAHHNINYSQYPTRSWIDPTNTQPNFCVTVDDRDGTYAADGKTIQVKFYLDGLGGDICTKTTLDTAGSQQICLVDATPCITGGVPVAFNPAILKFANSSPTVQQTHKVTARLFDEATSLEFDRSNVTPSNGSYPIEWNIHVLPTNTAPIMSFSTTQPTGCTSFGSFTKSGCQVNQGQDFTVRFKVQDDFYDPAIDPGQFQWNVNLKLNGVDVPGSATVCSKAFGTALTVPAASGPYVSDWSCTLQVPHFTPNGPLSPSAGAYSVVATMQDFGSPVGGGGLISTSLNWNLVVTETNPGTIAINTQTGTPGDSHVANGAIILDPAGTTFATEKDTVTFRINVTDPQLDNFKYRISLCTTNTAACPTSTALTVPSYVDFVRSLQADPSLNPVLVGALAYTLPEDLLLQISPQLDVNKTTPQLVRFKVEVEDVPSVPLTAVTKDTKYFQIYVRNYNPAPVIDTATASPLVGTTSVVYSGFPFTINPGTVTDSGPATETDIKYQWYAKTGAGAWTLITGATFKTLRYTPGNITTNIELKLCVGDRAAANPISSTGTCTGSWIVTPKKYLENLTATGTTAGRDEIAVWYDDSNPLVYPGTQTMYTAYVGTDGVNNRIFVEKTIKNAAGNIVKTSTITFYPLATEITSGVVTNLSISGTGNSIYVAYLASASASPTVMVPRIRRIDKSFESGVREKFLMSHLTPFGFNYSHYSGTSDCAGVACAQVTFTSGNGIGGFAAIDLAEPRLASGNTITINGYTFTASNNPAAANQICDATVCLTPASLATNIAQKINNSTDPLLQGITAKANSSTVELYGQYHDDFLDFDGSIALVPGFAAEAGGMGKIFFTGGRWNLPLLDITNKQVVVFSGPADQHLRATLPIDTANYLSDMGQVFSFDAAVAQSGELIFARISGNPSTAGRMKLFRYTLSGTTWVPVIPGGTAQASQDVFGMLNFEFVKLAANKVGNNHLYVIAREKADNGSSYHLGRFSPTLDTAVTPLEYPLENRLLTTVDSGVISDSLIKAPVVVSVRNTPEARIFFHSVGTGATPYPRLARWKADDLITCGTCVSLTGTQAILASSKIAVSELAPAITLGNIGSVAGENTKDLFFLGLMINTTATPAVYLPYLGIINAQNEAIQSTSVDGTGLWRPPFILDQ